MCTMYGAKVSVACVPLWLTYIGYTTANPKRIALNKINKMILNLYKIESCHTQHNQFTAQHNPVTTDYNPVRS